MEHENEIIETTPKSMYASICIVQAIGVAVIITVMIIIKLFFKAEYAKLETWCEEELFEETQITANFDEGV